MSEPYRFMLIFTLGPVQTFIAQARKTRDLWIGSLLFSKLMEAAMQDITITEQAVFIFPEERHVENIPDLPNKYIMLFQQEEQARKTVELSLQQIRQAWHEMTSLVWEKCIARYADETTKEIWSRQTGVSPDDANPDHVKLDALFDVFWVITERGQPDMSDRRSQQTLTTEAYGDWLRRTENLLNARKRLRDFLPREETGEKSPISGEREILHKRNASTGAIEDFWNEVGQYLSAKDITKKAMPMRGGQKSKERLDAIDVVKRFAMQANAIQTTSQSGEKQPLQQPFPSTSSIATVSFVEQLLLALARADEDDRLHEAIGTWEQIAKKINHNNQSRQTLAERATAEFPYLQTLVQQFTHGKYRWLLELDGDLYFPATFTTKRLAEEYEFNDHQQIAEGKQALTHLLEVVCHPQRSPYAITQPKPYYAVIQMDGDKMGILLSGSANELEHNQMNKALSQFARHKVPEIVEQRYPARVVYAGGDDVLALAPLARDTVQDGEPGEVFALVDLLQQAYVQEVQNALSTGTDPTTIQANEKRRAYVTASVGLVIAHHYTSLSYVLRTVRETEEQAKRTYGRNALVVTLIRRSGEQTRVGCHWRYPGLDDEGQPIALFTRFYQLFKDDILSPTCVYTLLEEAPTLVTLATPITALLDPKQAGNGSPMESEIRRILKRQRASEKKDRFTDETLTRYARYLVELASAMDADAAKTAQGPGSQALSVDLHAHERRYGLVETLGWLLVMAFLARKEHEE